MDLYATLARNPRAGIWAITRWNPDGWPVIVPLDLPGWKRRHTPTARATTYQGDWGPLVIHHTFDAALAALNTAETRLNTQVREVVATAERILTEAHP